MGRISSEFFLGVCYRIGNYFLKTECESSFMEKISKKQVGQSNKQNPLERLRKVNVKNKKGQTPLVFLQSLFDDLYCRGEPVCSPFHKDRHVGLSLHGPYNYQMRLEGALDYAETEEIKKILKNTGGKSGKR